MGFQLTPAEVPPQKRAKRSQYKDILDQFLTSGLESARVDGTSYKPTTLASGLRKTSEASKMGVTVVLRKSEVFLIRDDEGLYEGGRTAAPDSPRF